MTTPSHPEQSWRKSSYSGGNGNCVEVALARHRVAVRDSKDPDGGHLRLSTASWRALLTAVDSGR